MDVTVIGSLRAMIASSTLACTVLVGACTGGKTDGAQCEPTAEVCNGIELVEARSAVLRVRGGAYNCGTDPAP